MTNQIVEFDINDPDTHHVLTKPTRQMAEVALIALNQYRDKLLDIGDLKLTSGRIMEIDVTMIWLKKMANL